MGCSEIRDRLADYALAGLPEDEARLVARHLEWCAGCKKELAELQDGVAALGWALEPAQPPVELEARVLDAVAGATGTRVRERRRFRMVTAVAVAASFVAIAAAGWAMAMAGSLGQARADQQRSADAASQLEGLVDTFGGQRILPALLSPTAEHTGGGRAIVYLSGGKGADWVLVIVGGLPLKDQPYRASLVHASGVEVPVGRLYRSQEGQFSAYRFFTQDLAGFDKLVVTDARGQVVLRGMVRT